MIEHEILPFAKSKMVRARRLWILLVLVRIFGKDCLGHRRVSSIFSVAAVLRTQEVYSRGCLVTIIAWRPVLAHCVHGVQEESSLAFCSW